VKRTLALLATAIVFTACGATSVAPEPTPSPSPVVARTSSSVMDAGPDMQGANVTYLLSGNLF
jgi:hypothetical protein